MVGTATAQARRSIVVLVVISPASDSSRIAVTTAASAASASFPLTLPRVSTSSRRLAAMRCDMFASRKSAARPSGLPGWGRVAARALMRSGCATSRRTLGTSRGFSRSGMWAKVKIALPTPSAKAASCSRNASSSASRTGPVAEFSIAPTRTAGATAKARGGRWSNSRAIDSPIRATIAGAIPSVNETA